MANNYCLITDITAQIPETDLQSSTDYDEALAFLITAASRLIDREVGRWDGYFYPATSDETRYYDGTGSAELWVDEFLSVSGLVVDGVTFSSTDYIMAPYNAPQNGQPYCKLIIDPDGAQVSFSGGRRAIALTGVFGWSATPPALIKQACIVQVIRWHMRAKQMYQDTGANTSFAAYTITGRLDDDIARMLAPYRANSLAEHD